MWYSQNLLMDSLKPGTVLVNARGGSVTAVKLKEGLYRIRLVGSGGYGGERANSLSACGGGGGSGVKLVVETYLKKGTYYYYAACSVTTSPSDGAWFSPQSTFSSETAYFHAGGGYKAANRNGGAGGSSVIAKNPFGYMKILDQLNGNDGGRAPSTAVVGTGGASVDVDGISGKGGDGNPTAGTSIGFAGENGRIEITYLGRFKFTPGSVVYEKYGGNAAEDVFLLPGSYKMEIVGGGGGQGGFATNSGVAFGAGGGGSGAAVSAVMTVSEEAVFQVCSGNVGSTNRGYVGSGEDGGDSWIREKNNTAVFVACRSSGTGSGGWSGHGNGGTVEDQGFLTKYSPGAQVLLRQNGNAGTAGGVVGGWGTGGASVYQGHGAGSGGDKGDGSSGMVRITFLE